MTETDDKSSSGTLPANPRLRFGRLDTIGGIVTELGRLYRGARRGEFPTQDASRLAFLLTQIRRAAEGADIERRLAALEAAVQEATK